MQLVSLAGFPRSLDHETAINRYNTSLSNGRAIGISNNADEELTGIESVISIVWKLPRSTYTRPAQIENELDSTTVT